MYKQSNIGRRENVAEPGQQQISHRRSTFRDELKKIFGFAIIFGILNVKNKCLSLEGLQFSLDKS